MINSNSYARLRAWSVLLALSALLAFTAWAESRLVVETTTMSAHREAVRGCLHLVDMETGEANFDPIVMPGVAPAGPLLLTPGEDAVITSSGPAWDGEPISPRAMPNFVSVHGLSPLDDPPLGRRWAPQEWREQAALTVSEPRTGETQVVILGTRITGNGAGEGRLRLQPLAGGALDEAALEWPLPGPPVLAVELPGHGRIAVLCRDSVGTGALLHVRNVFTGSVAVEALDVGREPGGLPGAEPSGLAVDSAGEHLLILLSGPAYQQPGGRMASALHVLDIRTLEPVGEAVSLLGVGDPEADAVQPAQPPHVWVATRSPQTGFGYAYRLRLDDDGATIDRERSYTGATRSLQLAASAEYTGAAVGVEDRVEIVAAGGESNHVSFDAPVRALHWSSAGLFVGEGNRVHWVDPQSGELINTVGFQTGHVTGLVSLAPDSPAHWADWAVSAGLDSETPPETRTPRLQVPSVVQFYGEAVGRQMRAVLIDPDNGDGLDWRISFDEEEMPWLRAHPRSGVTPRGVSYMGVDPGDYGRPREVLDGVLTVEVFEEDGVTPIAGSPAEVLVRVAPERSHIRRILWIVDANNQETPLRHPSDPHELRGLAEFLAGPPHHFSHSEYVGGAVKDLEPYHVVVLGARAAARGAVTRQALLDYVAGGGALLFLGEHFQAEEGRTLRRWLSPMGIQIHTDQHIEGVFSTNRRERLAQRWQDFRITDGCGIRVDDPGAIMVPGVTGTPWSIFVAEYHGVGHIAMLAAPTPLTTAAMENTANQAFATALFEWLGQSGALVSDLDGDGLPDHLEDRNMDGVVAPGETDPLNPDTDGDGIPDGVEDQNRSGRVDPGETSPLNPDSDGDGIWDGADPNPLPPVDAPHVERVEPWSAPVEGGAEVLITGRNFTADSVVWFGGRPAPRVRSLGATNLLAEVPPRDLDEAGAVDVRVTIPALDLDGVLPGGFLYAPRTVVEITLESLERAGAAHAADEGVLAVHINAPTDARVGGMSILLETEPPGMLEWGAVSPGSGAEYGRRQVRQRPAPTGGVWLDWSAPVRGPTRGVHATVGWRRADDAPEDEPIRVYVDRSSVRAPNGQPLDVVTEDVQLSTGSR